MRRRRYRGAADTAPTPTLSSVSPSAGASAGSTAVTLTGTGFRSPGQQFSVAFVTFATVASGVSVASATSLTCTTPAHAVGTVDVRVGGPGGWVTLTNGFTFGGLTTEAVVRLETESGSYLTTET